MNEPTSSPSPALPPVLAGPLLRRVETTRLVFWLVGSEALTLRLHLDVDGEPERVRALSDDECTRIRVGTSAWLHLIDVKLDEPLPHDRPIRYDLRLLGHAAEPGIAQWAPHLLHEGERMLLFVIRPRFDNLLHGSCRKPHHASADGLVCVDRLLDEARQAPEQWPAALLMTGDQIYADDVAGPMLVAIHALIRRLGLYGECLEGALVADSAELLAHPATYYRREQLLPAFKASEALRERFFGGAEKPVFTTANAHNHLVTLSEVLAMYLLVWSPVPWQLIDPAAPPLDGELVRRYAREAEQIDAFRRSLPRAARALAHVSTLMIFDDHDITDDWNLSARWEETAYGHPFSRRIIGNALAAYLLCQGWGNQPEARSSLGGDRLAGADVRRQADRDGTAGVQLARLLAAGRCGKLDGPSRCGAGDAQHLSPHAHTGQLRDSLRRRALLVRLRNPHPWPAQPSAAVADHQQRREKRVPAPPAGYLRPPESLALLAAFAAELADQTPKGQGTALAAQP